MAELLLARRETYFLLRVSHRCRRDYVLVAGARYRSSAIIVGFSLLTVLGPVGDGAVSKTFGLNISSVASFLLRGIVSEGAYVSIIYLLSTGMEKAPPQKSQQGFAKYPGT